jgi:hypothetical protein
MNTSLRSFLLVALMTLGGTIQLLAQEQTINNVGRTSLRNLGEIFENEDVRGYYFFYESDKVDRLNRIYEVVIWDENLKEVTSKQMQENKNVYLLESAYNGSAILFKFYDRKEKQVIYRTIDNKGNMSERITRPAEKMELYSYNAAITNNSENMSLFPVSKSAFVDVHITKPKKYSYSVEVINNSGQVTATCEGGQEMGYTGGMFLTATDDQILIMESLQKSITSKDVEFALVGYSMNGKEDFRTKFATPQYNLMPHSAMYDESSKDYLLMGEYYLASEKMVKAESKGVFLINSTTSGKLENENFLDWERDIKPKTKGGGKESDDKFSIFFHDIVRTQNGTILAVGEQYRKRLSALGVAGAMLGGGDSDVALAEMRIGDLALIEINSRGKVEEMNMYDKKDRTVLLPKGYEWVGAHVLGKMLKAMGEYDYRFRQFNEDRTVLTVGFYDREKEEGKMLRDLKFILTSYVEADGSFSTSKIDVKTKGEATGIYRGKPGYILIGDVNRKEKTIFLRLEPVNY